jgi:hypothetical protein
MLRSGEWARGSRARGALERGGESPEGAWIPQARRTIARGGAEPSSAAKNRPKGRLSLERGGESWCGAWPSSEMEVRPRGAEVGCLMGC